MPGDQTYEAKQRELKTTFNLLDEQYNFIAGQVADPTKLTSATVGLINRRSQGNFGAASVLAQLLNKSSDANEFIQAAANLPVSPAAIWDQLRPRSK